MNEKNKRKNSGIPFSHYEHFLQILEGSDEKNYCYLWVNLSLNLNAARTANYARQTVFKVNS